MHLSIAKQKWEHYVQPGDLVIDATCGNGKDLLFLAKLLGGKGSLVAYDIQKEALEQAELTLSSLNEQERSIISLKLASHEHFTEENAALIVYNLGYLPGGDKSLTTMTASTLTSLKNALTTLKPGGLLSVTCYPGHEEGAREALAVRAFFEELEWPTTHIPGARERAPHLFFAVRPS